MVDLASDAFKLQLTPLVVHEEVFCNVGPLNIAKKFLKTIIGIKDTVKVRRDLQRRNIRPHLWLTRNSERGGKMVKP
jgi:hypothetical protein